MLGYDWKLCMVINISSVQYNGGLLPDIIPKVTTIGEPVSIPCSGFVFTAYVVVYYYYHV